MSSTQSAYDWLHAKAADAVSWRDRAPEPVVEERPSIDAARAEMDRLLGQVEDLVAVSNDVQPRSAIDQALGAVAELQVVTANFDACNPPKGEHLGKALVAFADRRLTGHADAIERGMTYTSDNTMRLLRGK